MFWRLTKFQVTYMLFLRFQKKLRILFAAKLAHQTPTDLPQKNTYHISSLYNNILFLYTLEKPSWLMHFY